MSVIYLFSSKKYSILCKNVPGFTFKYPQMFYSNTAVYYYLILNDATFQWKPIAEHWKPVNH